MGYIGGQLVGLLGDCGRLGADEGQKGAHFVQLCDLRGIPLVFMQNNSSSEAYDDDYKVIKERSKFIQVQAAARFYFNTDSESFQEKWAIPGIFFFIFVFSANS